MTRLSDRATRIVYSSVLTDEQLAEAQALAEICNQHESLDYLHLNPEMATEAESVHLGKFLCYENGTLVGFILLFFGVREAVRDVEVYLIVHPDHRRRGIGRGLLKAALELCKSRGVKECILVSEDKSQSGIAFAGNVQGEHRFSEYRMKLDPGSLTKGRQSDDYLSLQQANHKDAELLARLIATSFGTPVEEHLERVKQHLGKTTHRFYIARFKEEPIGSVGVVSENTRVYIIALGVLPECRGRGFGRQILTQIASNLIAENWNEILIEVQTDNQNALSLYRSCGFKDTTSYSYYRLKS